MRTFRLSFMRRLAAPSKFQQKVGALFSLLRNNLPADLNYGHLAQIEQQALINDQGWRDNFEAYIAALSSAGLLPSKIVAGLIDELDSFPVKGPEPTMLVFALAWAALASVATVLWMVGHRTDWILTVGALVTVGFGGLWAWFSKSLPKPIRRNVARTRERLYWATFCGFAAALLLPVTTAYVTLWTSDISQHYFSAQRDNFKKSREFLWIRDFAKQNHGMEVILGDTGSGWKATSRMLPGGSPASVELRPGYCEINADSRLLASFVDFDEQQAAQQWTKGVLMHELGHCLDLARDLPAFGAPLKPDLPSVAPRDRHNVRDLISLVDRYESADTALWREALSDVMAVGYWRLQGGEVDNHLIQAVLHKRLQKAKDDPAHATACWINHARSAALPRSQGELFTWADTIRTVAQCGTNIAGHD